MNGKTFRLLNKCMWQSGAEDLYRQTFRQTLRTRASTGQLDVKRRHLSKLYSTDRTRDKRGQSSNPMLNGVSMLQWFFDEVKPDQREVRYWMKYFSQKLDAKKPFAVIQICEDVYAQEEKDRVAKQAGKLNRTILETLALSLYFLQQNKMSVLVLVGSNLSTSDVKESKRIREEINQHIKSLVDALEENGAKTHPIFNGGLLFNTDSNFNIESLNVGHLDWLCGYANIPVIGCIGESHDGTLGPVHLDAGTHFLSTFVQPLKVLMLNADGGILDENQQRITTVFLPKASELQKFLLQPWWSDGMHLRFTSVCDLLKILPNESSYVITSANDVLTELLTQRGKGTMFKRVVPVSKHTNLHSTVETSEGKERKLLDILNHLVESAFERPLSDHYWKNLPNKLNSVYLTDDLKACAVVCNVPNLPNISYLDKFVVAKEERGNFNIEVLWQQLKHDHRQLFWRSNPANVFNSWYDTRSEGVVKLGNWHVYCQNEDNSDLIDQLRTLALSGPISCRNVKGMACRAKKSRRYARK